MADAAADSALLAAAVRSGDRRALARAITLVESERLEDEAAAEALLAALLPHAGRARRVGVTGPPGAGKSTLIDALGRYLIARGERVAVLAIDPSSPVGGGSILGDKTRMARLAAHAQSFIRPSPARGASGGVGAHTAETLTLCEAAGYSVVLVETLGTGQGEHAVAELSDAVVLVLLAGAGDEVQGMKRGAIELADVVVVSKADGDGRAAAERAASDLESALGLFARATGAAKVPVIRASALEERGMDEIWTAVTHAIDAGHANGAILGRREAGARRLLGAEVDRLLRSELQATDHAATRERLEREVALGQVSARAAARRLLDALRGR